MIKMAKPPRHFADWGWKDEQRGHEEGLEEEGGRETEMFHGAAMSTEQALNVFNIT